jgi:hypothetical protein
MTQLALFDQSTRGTYAGIIGISSSTTSASGPGGIATRLQQFAPPSRIKPRDAVQKLSLAGVSSATGREQQHARQQQKQFPSSDGTDLADVAPEGGSTSDLSQARSLNPTISTSYAMWDTADRADPYPKFRLDVDAIEMVPPISKRGNPATGWQRGIGEEVCAFVRLFDHGPDLFGLGKGVVANVGTHGRRSRARRHDGHSNTRPVAPAGRKLKLRHKARSIGRAILMDPLARFRRGTGSILRLIRASRRHAKGRADNAMRVLLASGEGWWGPE